MDGCHRLVRRRRWRMSTCQRRHFNIVARRRGGRWWSRFLRHASPVPRAADHSPFFRLSAARVSTPPTGLRVVTQAYPAATRMASVSVWVDAGSRFELPGTNGIAHLLEHMAFKGTARRPTAHALEMEIEDMGRASSPTPPASRPPSLPTCRDATCPPRSTCSATSSRTCASRGRLSSVSAASSSARWRRMARGGCTGGAPVASSTGSSTPSTFLLRQPSPSMSRLMSSWRARPPRLRARRRGC